VAGNRIEFFSVRKAQEDAWSLPGPALFSSLDLVKSTLPPGTGPELGLFRFPGPLPLFGAAWATIAPIASIWKFVGRNWNATLTNAIQEFDARDPARVVEPHIAPALRNVARADSENVTSAPNRRRPRKYDLLFPPA